MMSLAGINPKLITLAAAYDKAEAEFESAVVTLSAAKTAFFHNRGDKVAKAAVEDARRLESGLRRNLARSVPRIWKNLF
jgi:hypothetical protein